MKHAYLPGTGKKSRRALILCFDWISTMIFALVTIVVVLTFFLRVVAVDGDSMLPTLREGDRLLLTRVVGSLEPGDVVVVDRYTDDPLIKRVIAVGGDVVEIDDSHRLFINGVYQRESYTTGYTIRRDMTSGPVTVPEGCVFVLGDNRSISKDSRMREIGMVSTKDVVGKVLYRVWPFSEAGRVKK